MDYSVNLVLCFLTGIFLKIYDDIIDNKLKVDIFYVDLLKYFVITLFSISLYNDGVFSTLWFVMGCSSLFMDKYYTSKLEKSKNTNDQKDFTCFNDTVWVYSLILSGIFMCYHGYIHRNSVFNYKQITFLISIIINIIIVVSDIYFTPEHSSNKKLYARIGMLIVLSSFIYYMSYFSEYIYEGNYGIILMEIGILISSTCFDMLDKWNMIDYLKIE